jgi:hypothetical protein
MSAVGALVSLLRGGQFYYEDVPASTGPPAPAPPATNGQAGGPVPSAPAGRPAPPLPRGTGVT